MTFKIETKYEMILIMRQIKVWNIINNDKWRWHDIIKYENNIQNTT